MLTPTHGVESPPQNAPVAGQREPARRRPVSFTVSDHHEAWGRVPQVLEDILAPDAYASVRVCIAASIPYADLMIGIS